MPEFMKKFGMTFAKKGHIERLKFAETEINQHFGKTEATRRCKLNMNGHLGNHISYLSNNTRYTRIFGWSHLDVGGGR